MNTSPISAVIVTTTGDSRAALEQIAEALVKRKLAACCQISAPVTSVFRWEGRVDRSEEYVCSIKTTTAMIDSVESLIRERHSYEEPEVVVTPIIGGSESYLRWIVESVVKE